MKPIFAAPCPGPCEGCVRALICIVRGRTMCAPDDSVSPGRFFLKAGTMMRKFFDFFNLKTGSIFRFLSGKLLIVSAGQYPSTVVRVGDVPVAPNHIARGRTMSAPGLRIRVGQYPHLGRRVGGCVEDLIHAGSSPPGPRGAPDSTKTIRRNPT